ncbi:hypothetical protein [Demequina aurantiaca]|uniref:hypothetical protein n=1 Tax=Demequina aurantiaca TaxID=676200 RepID=UPI003D355EA7
MTLSNPDTRTQVNWGNYPPIFRRLIEEETDAGNVGTLGVYLETWQRARDRGDKPALLAYLEEARELARENLAAWEGRLTG